MSNQFGSSYRRISFKLRTFRPSVSFSLQQSLCFPCFNFIILFGFDIFVFHSSSSACRQPHIIVFATCLPARLSLALPGLRFLLSFIFVFAQHLWPYRCPGLQPPHFHHHHQYHHHHHHNHVSISAARAAQCRWSVSAHGNARHFGNFATYHEHHAAKSWRINSAQEHAQRSSNETGAVQSALWNERKNRCVFIFSFIFSIPQLFNYTKSVIKFRQSLFELRISQFSFGVWIRTPTHTQRRS